MEVKIHIAQEGKKPRIEQFGKLEDARDFLVSICSEVKPEPEASQEEAMTKEEADKLKEMEGEIDKVKEEE